MSAGTLITADGCRLAYESVGDGLPVLWQHGLGADRKQPAEVFPSLGGVRRIMLEYRGHGESSLGDPERLSIATFADDALALLDHLGVRRAVAGGISLGAAVALQLAAFHGERVSGLILGRPAWVDGPSPTMAPYLEVAELLGRWGMREGAQRFERSAILQAVEAVSPDNAQSLRSFFTRPNKDSTIALLSRIPLDSPRIGGAFEQVQALALIIANEQEYVHPVAYARELLGLLPQARLQIITSKTTNRAAYVREFQEALREFLTGLQASAAV